ncbi:MAG: CBS domain-containing protein [bacterium]
MGTIENDQFDDEFKSMQELMDEVEITLKDNNLQIPLSALALKSPVLVETGTSIDQCIQTFLQNHIDCILVVENNELRGIFTEWDVLMKIVGLKNDLAKINVNDYMTPNPITLNLKDPIVSALRLMHQGGYRHIPLMDEKNYPVRIISVKDIVSYIVEFFPQEVLNLPPHPIRVGTKNREGG